MVTVEKNPITCRSHKEMLIDMNLCHNRIKQGERTNWKENLTSIPSRSLEE